MDGRGLKIRPGKWIASRDLDDKSGRWLSRFRILLMPSGLVTGFCDFWHVAGLPSFGCYYPVHKTFSLRSVWLLNPVNETVFWFAENTSCVMGTTLNVRVMVPIHGTPGICDSGYSPNRPVVAQMLDTSGRREERRVRKETLWRQKKSVSPSP